MNSLQAVVNTYIVSQLTQTHERNEILNAFKDMDKNNDGIISYSELFQVLEEMIAKKMKDSDSTMSQKEKKNKTFL